MVLGRSSGMESHHFSPSLGLLPNMRPPLLVAAELSVWINSTAELPSPELLLRHFGTIGRGRQAVLVMKNTDFSFSPGLNSFVLLSTCHSWPRAVMFVPAPRWASPCPSDVDLHQQSPGPFVR